MRAHLRLVSCAALAIAGTASAQSGPVPNAFAPEITASARGEVRQPADRAWVNFSVETRDGLAAQAGALNSQQTSRLLEALKAAGVASSDIVTSGYNVSQNYEGEGRPRPAGFIARNSIRVTVSKLDNVGRIIDAGLGGGATQVYTMQLGPIDSNDARRRALALAVADARRDAEAMAVAAGGSLGRLISLTSTSSPMMREAPMNDMIMGGMVTSASGYSGPTPFTPREVTISAIAFGRWEFIPASKQN